MKKFGGTGHKQQCCKLRKCIKQQLSTQEMPVPKVCNIHIIIAIATYTISMCIYIFMYVSQQEKRSPSHAPPTPNETSSAKIVANTNGKNSGAIQNILIHVAIILDVMEDNSTSQVAKCIM